MSSTTAKIIPDGWQAGSISSFGEIISGGTPSRANCTFWNGNIPWVTPSEITKLKDKWLDETPEKITAAGLAGSGARLMPAGSVVVTTRASLGGMAIARVPLTTNQGFKNIVPNSETDSLFCFYAVAQLAQEMERRATGTTFLEISKGDFSSIPLIHPLKLEQSRIAEILDTLDAAIREAEGVVTKLRQIKAGLLHDLLTRGLDDNGELRDPARHPEQFQASPLGAVPKLWSVEKLGNQLTGIEAGHSPSCPSFPAAPGQWGVLKVSAVTRGGFVAQENKAIQNRADVDESCEVMAGDLLMTRCNTPDLVGAACLVAATPSALMLCDKTLRLRVNSERDCTAFLVNVLNMPATRRQIEISATGSSGSMKNISQSDIRGYWVPRPAFDEQQRIASRIGALAQSVDTEIVGIQKLQSLKHGLAHDLLTGRVRVKC